MWPTGQRRCALLASAPQQIRAPLRLLSERSRCPSPRCTDALSKVEWLPLEAQPPRGDTMSIMQIVTGRAAVRLARPFRSFEARLGIVVFTLALIFAGAHGVLAHEFKFGDLEIGHPWSRATPHGAQVAGGYMTITNQGSSADRLVSVSSDISDKAEIHEMAVKDGVMTMRPVEGGLEIPAGATIELKPGGYHLM